MGKKGQDWKQTVIIGNQRRRGEPEVTELQWRKQREEKDSGEVKGSSPGHAGRFEMGHEGEGQNLGWPYRLPTGWRGRWWWRLPMILWEQAQPLRSLFLCLIACRFPSSVALFVAPNFCTLHFLSQQWLSPLPRVCLVKHPTFKPNFVVHLKNIPWLGVLPPGCLRSF